MSVYACSKNTPVEDCNATVGKLLCAQHPVYGGSDNPSLIGTRFDEPGYIAIPDCFWGSAEFGLEPSPDLTGVPLYMVKTSNVRGRFACRFTDLTSVCCRRRPGATTARWRVVSRGCSHRASWWMVAAVEVKALQCL